MTTDSWFDSMPQNKIVRHNYYTTRPGCKFAVGFFDDFLTLKIYKQMIAPIMLPEIVSDIGYNQPGNLKGFNFFRVSRSRKIHLQKDGKHHGVFASKKDMLRYINENT